MAMQAMWCVWTERGDYEQWSRDLRGVFATADLAEAHASQLREADHPDVCEVVEEDVLTTLPTRVPYIRWSAHLTPAGEEDPRRGYNRGVQFETWSNEIAAAHGRLALWNRPESGDLYIEVIGCDEAAVAAEYDRLLMLAREQQALMAKGTDS